MMMPIPYVVVPDGVSRTDSILDNLTKVTTVTAADKLTSRLGAQLLAQILYLKNQRRFAAAAAAAAATSSSANGNRTRSLLGLVTATAFKKVQRSVKNNTSRLAVTTAANSLRPHHHQQGRSLSTAVAEAQLLLKVLAAARATNCSSSSAVVGSGRNGFVLGCNNNNNALIGSKVIIPSLSSPHPATTSSGHHHVSSSDAGSAISITDNIVVLSRPAKLQDKRVLISTSEMPGTIRSMNSVHNREPDQPEADAIKMFVGQIPRSMDENELKKMFEDFGQVYQINVLRDRVTGQSKGCCFVTFFTRKAALDAQNALHNIKTMTGMHHPIQMKPADSENRNERKLFIGMLSKKCNENDVRGIFAPFGTIEECTVLRDTNGQSKGCAFVTYASKQCATNAIKAMHQSQTMEGCSSPLVVKFADTQKEKDQKRIQQMNSLWNITNTNISPLSPQYLALAKLLLQQASTAGNANTYTNMGQLQSVSALNMQQLAALAAAQSAVATSTTPGIQSLSSQGLGGLAVSNSVSSTPDFSAANLQGLAALANIAATNSGLNPMSMQNLAALAAASNSTSSSIPGISTSARWLNVPRAGSLPVTTSTANHTLSGLSGVGSVGSMSLGMSANSLSSMAASVNGLGSTTGIAASNGPSIEALTQAYSGIQQYAAAFPSAFTQTNLSQAPSPVSRQVEAGPDGANLFIYHLPQEFGDNDLAQTFMPFGNVISAKVFIDKMTNLSKCFGFVSYDNPVSAQAAIQSMNGFQIGMKRLKVQLKRSKDKPY